MGFDGIPVDCRRRKEMCVSQTFTCLAGYRRQARGRQESAATRFLKFKDRKGPAKPLIPRGGYCVAVYSRVQPHSGKY